MNTDVLINWFESRRGKLTYSMYGSRNGSDGTADCSGSVSQALKEAGVPIQGLPSTVTLGSQLANNGFIRVSKNTDWTAQRGDIVMMSWGSDMSTSGGAGGHVGVMEDANTFISVDYWTGGAAGQAVSSHNWDQYYYSQRPRYVEAWRYNGSGGNQQPNTSVNQTPTRKPDSKAYYLANDVAFVNGIYQIKCDYLAPVGFDWTDNGIPVGMVNWVDENGNNIKDGADKDFKPGMYFSFAGDEVNITDTGEGGYSGGWYWRKFDFGQFGGTVWLSVRDKDDLVNYYKPNTSVSQTPTRKPDSKAYYLANDVAFVNGIYQIKCDYLAPADFDWTDNGIPVSMVNWVDKDGNDIPDGADKDFKPGMYFSFAGDEVNITDTGEGGYSGGWYWRKFDFGQFGGTVWLSVRDKDDLVNYYK